VTPISAAKSIGLDVATIAFTAIYFAPPRLLPVCRLVDGRREFTSILHLN
jgi:hypothetical protein